MSTMRVRSFSLTQVSTIAGAGAVLGRGLTRAIDLLYEWSERAHQRRRLQLLTQRDLRDLGLTLADVDREASKPFWRP